MIIKRLKLYNFGIYAYLNMFVFKGAAPVILIGGMNGRGKTTFLEAVLLGLYGSNSFAFQETKFKYKDYLASYTNKSDASQMAYIEIEFSMGKYDSETYTIHREWSKKSKFQEHIWVKKNGEDNAFLTENWTMFIENILPSALSKFFFFDGEKIAALAENNTSEQIKESIKTMLGVSILDTLENDLNKIISKISKSKKGDNKLDQLEILKHEKEKAIVDLQEVDSKIADKNAVIIKLKAKLESKKNNYTLKGGNIVSQKHDLIAKRAESISALNLCNESLSELASSEIPLKMVSFLLKDIEVQSEQEFEQKKYEITLEKIKELQSSFSNKEHTDISSFISFVQDKVATEKKTSLYNLSNENLFKLRDLIKNKITASIDKAKKITKEREKYKNSINEIDNYLSVDIDDEVLNKLFKEIKTLENTISEEEISLKFLEEQRKTLNGIAIKAESEFSKAAEEILSSIETDEEEGRSLKYLYMAQKIFAEYQKKLQARKTEILAKEMTNCFARLANKKSLVSKITMDPVSLDLHYFDIAEHEVIKARLSSGEKQLMVISLLWALALCSKKKLPVIIDTPLSRLDSAHRGSLINTYFPNASDQTIILSTDTEVDRRYYNMMRPFIGDEYTLEYNDTSKRTVVRRGYFGWGE